MRTTIIILTLLLAGCGGDPEPQPTPGPGEQPASQPASQPANEPPPNRPSDPRAAEARDHAERGMKLMNEGNLEEAVQSLDRAIQLQPGDPNTLAARALAHNYLGQPEKALADVSKAIELTTEKPFQLDLIGFRGSVLTEAGRFAEAEKDLTQAIDGGKDDAELRLNRAISRLELDRPDEAMADVEKALGMTASEGAKAVLYQVRGLVKEKKGDIPGALADLEKSVAMGNAEAQEDLDRLKTRKGQ